MCRKLRAVNCDVKSMRLLWWSRLARCAISPRLKKVKVPRLNEVFKVFHTTNEAEGGHNGVKDILNLYFFFVKNASREPCWFHLHPNVFLSESGPTVVVSSPPEIDIAEMLVSNILTITLIHSPCEMIMNAFSVIFMAYGWALYKNCCC